MCRSLANSFQPLVQLVFFSHMSLSLSTLSNRVSPHQIPKIYGIAIFLEDLGMVGSVETCNVIAKTIHLHLTPSLSIFALDSTACMGSTCLS